MASFFLSNVLFVSDADGRRLTLSEGVSLQRGFVHTLENRTCLWLEVEAVFALVKPDGQPWFFFSSVGERIGLWYYGVSFTL